VRTDAADGADEQVADRQNCVCERDERCGSHPGHEYHGGQQDETGTQRVNPGSAGAPHGGAADQEKNGLEHLEGRWQGSAGRIGHDALLSQYVVRSV
jgi:hypothetical protein